MKRRRVMHLLLTLTLMLAADREAFGNGEEFFTTRKPSTGPSQLAYTGRIRDKDTRRPVQGNVYINITDTQNNLTFFFTNDSPGRYRSPDIGASVTELSGKKTAPGQLEFQINADGYKTIVLNALPRDNSGLVPFDVLLERDPAVTPVASASDVPAAPAHDQPRWGFVVIGILALGVMVGIAARTSALRRSTTH